MKKRLIIFAISMITMFATSIQIFVSAGGTTQMEEKTYKENGKYKVVSGQGYYSDGEDFFDRHDNLGDMDITYMVDLNEQTALDVSYIIFKKIYGEDFFSDKVFGVNEYKDKNMIVVSLSYKNKGLEGPWWALAINKENGKVLKIWSHDEENLKDKLDITPRMALDIADTVFAQLFGGSKFFIENNYFIVEEIENSNIIVVIRMNDNIDIDGGDISLAIDKKSGMILKMWLGE